MNYKKTLEQLKEMSPHIFNPVKDKRQDFARQEIIKLSHGISQLDRMKNPPVAHKEKKHFFSL